VQCSNEITIAITNIGRKFRRVGSRCNTKSPGLRPISTPSTILSHRVFGHNKHRPQFFFLGGGLRPLFGEGNGVPITQSRLSRGLAPYQVASWSMQPFGCNRYGPKIGGRGLCTFEGVEAGSPSNTMWPGTRTTCMPSLILIHPTVWPQYTNVTGRQTGQDNGPIA